MNTLGTLQVLYPFAFIAVAGAIWFARKAIQ